MNDETPAPDLEPASAGGPAREAYPFWGYQDLLVLFGLGIPVMIVATVLVRLVVVLLPGEEKIPAIAVLAVQFVTYGLWFLCLWALLKMKYDRPFWRSLAWVKSDHPAVLFMLLGPVLAFAVGLAGTALQTPELQMPMMRLMQDRVSLLIVGVFAVSLGPICEELAFRGFALPLLARSLGPAAGVLITSVVFAAMHGPQYAWSWRHLLLITAAGAAFAVTRLRTGSTASATLMHATYNLTFFLAYLVQWNELHV